MSHFDAAGAAVQAALDAGARYADARVMVRRSESMTARDGDLEDLGSVESAGLGVRALVGSSWGFYAVPDLSDAAARSAGHQAAQIAAASGLVAGPEIDLVPARPIEASWSSRCAIDPFGVSLSVKGDLLVAATRPPGRRAPTWPRRITRSGTPASGSSPARGIASTSTSARPGPG